MLVKCSHCGKMLSADDFDSHKCELLIKECRRIEVVYFNDDFLQGQEANDRFGG